MKPWGFAGHWKATCCADLEQLHRALSSGTAYCCGEGCEPRQQDGDQRVDRQAKRLTDELRRSLKWDRGKERAQKRVQVATDVARPTSAIHKVRGSAPNITQGFCDSTPQGHQPQRHYKSGG